MWYFGGAFDDDDGDEPVTLSSLPAELQQLVVSALPNARCLTAASGCCKSWRQVAYERAVKRLAHFGLKASEAQWILSACGSGNFEELGNARGCRSCPWPLRALYGAERLFAAVGPPPSNRSWRDEWAEMRMRQAWLLAFASGPEHAAQFTTRVAAIGPANLTQLFEHGAGAQDLSLG